MTSSPSSIEHLSGDHSLFERWTGKRTLRSIGTNDGAPALAFQEWHRFKEAFVPELIHRAVVSSPIPVSSCIDPFGGSGTTALAAQFLGVASTTIEVNPFLVDVARAKLARYDADALAVAFSEVQSRSRTISGGSDLFGSVPPTFLEPGVRGRWLFNRDVAERLGAILTSINAIEDEVHRRFFRVLLGGMLVDHSNTVISGKGRRYRRDWQNRTISANNVDFAFSERVQRAIVDVYRFAARPDVISDVIQSDARTIKLEEAYDLAVFSPPYPNSFDYTDVYNIELWMMGYLNDREENWNLRRSTLSSHVQLHRDFLPAPPGSVMLDETVAKLHEVKDALWSPWIPDMVGGYFADMVDVLAGIGNCLRPKALCWIVVGDSKYGGITVPVAAVLQELVAQRGWSVESFEPFRSMRSSPQHGGRSELPETLLVLSKSSL